MSRVRVRVWPVDRALGVNKQQGRRMPGPRPHQEQSFHESPAISALFAPLGSSAWSPAARFLPATVTLHPGPARPTLCPCPVQWGPCKEDGAQTERAQYLSMKWEVQAYMGSGDRPLSTSAALSVCLPRQVSSFPLRPETKTPRQGVCPGSQTTPTGPKLQPGPASETSQQQM